MSSQDTIADFLERPDDDTPPAEAVRPVLVVLDSRGFQERHVLKQLRSTIGRETDCTVLVTEGVVSRHHAIVTYANWNRAGETPACTLADNNSKNGTFLNGKRIAEPQPLANGDRIDVGNACLYFFLRNDLEIRTDSQLHTLATTDALTGLSNRAFMDIQFQREFERAVRYDRPLSVLLIDLDNFKGVNDAYGHPFGDFVLRRTARIVRSTVRMHDIAARYGGEEFAVLLIETESAGALAIAERIRDAVECHEYSDGTAMTAVTTSIGVATRHLEENETMADLVARADAALYRAKRGGKNRVVSG